MNCNSISLANVVKDCTPSKGGIRRVLMAVYAPDIYALSGDSITGISSGTTWYEYQLRKNTGSMTSTLNVDATVGLNYVSTELLIQFARMDTEHRIQAQALSLGDLACIVEDCNGTYFALGVEEPVVATAGNGQTGQNKSDGNFYQITLTDESSSYPLTIPANLIPTPAADPAPGL